MYYQLVGDRSSNVIVFLHGWGTDSSSFEGVLSLLPKRNFCYLLLDFPGFGKSVEPGMPYTVYDYAGEVINLLDELNIQKATFIGHSFGGRVAVMLASRFKERVEKVVLVDGAGIVVNRGLVYRCKVIKYKVLKKLGKFRIFKKALTKCGSEDYKALKSEIMRKTFVQVVNEDLKKDAKNIHCNTLLIWGRLDKATPLKVAKIYNKLIEGSKLVVIEDAGHYCFLDKMDEFVYILYDNLFI